MRFKLLTYSFLICLLAVAPAFSQYTWHMNTPTTLRDAVTYYFGDSVYVKSEYDIRITAFFQNVSGTIWFNYTVAGLYSAYTGTRTRVYTSDFNYSSVYVNNVEQTEDNWGSACYWYESLGEVNVYVLSGATLPANVSISYGEFVPAEAEYINVLINGYFTNGSTVNGMPLTLNDTVNVYTVYTGTPFAILNNTLHYLTAVDTEHTFKNWTTGLTTRTIYFTLKADATLGLYYTPYSLSWFFPFTPIIGLVGLGLMFVAPAWAILQVKKQKYQYGLVWGVILTILGFALFLSWLFGGNF